MQYALILSSGALIIHSIVFSKGSVYVLVDTTSALIRSVCLSTFGKTNYSSFQLFAISKVTVAINVFFSHARHNKHQLIWFFTCNLALKTNPILPPM